jgi:hypothetical protein
MKGEKMSDIKIVSGLPELKMRYPEPPKLKEKENIFLFLTYTGSFKLDLAISFITTVVARRGSWGYVLKDDFESASQDGALRVADVSTVVNMLPVLQEIGLLELLQNDADGLVYIKPSVELAEMVEKSLYYVI